MHFHHNESIWNGHSFTRFLGTFCCVCRYHCHYITADCKIKIKITAFPVWQLGLHDGIWCKSPDFTMFVSHYATNELLNYLHFITNLGSACVVSSFWMVLLPSLSHLLAGRSVWFCWQGVAICWRGGYGSFDSHTEVWTWLFLCRMENCQFTDLTFQLLLLICVIYTNTLKFLDSWSFFVCLTFNNHNTTWFVLTKNCFVFFFFLFFFLPLPNGYVIFGIYLSENERILMTFCETRL